MANPLRTLRWLSPSQQTDRDNPDRNLLRLLPPPTDVPALDAPTPDDPPPHASIFTKRNPRDLPQSDPTAMDIPAVSVAPESLGDAPPPPTWNPLRYKASGQPEISPTATGSQTEIERKLYDATQAWNPRQHEHKGNRLMSALKSAGLAVASNPSVIADPASLALTAGIGAVRGAASRATPDLYRRKMALREAGSNLQASMGLDKEQAQTQGIVGAQDAREQNLLRQQERLTQTSDALAERTRAAQAREVLADIKRSKEFDPADPKNAGSVEAFRRVFGYTPAKTSDTSALTLVPGVGPDGKAQFSVINKATATAANVIGELPAQTEAGANRDSRESEGAANRDVRRSEGEANRANSRGNAEFVQGRIDRRQSSGSTPRTVRVPPEAKTLAEKYNEAKRNEMNATTDVDKAAWKREREGLWGQVMDTYPGVFETTKEGGEGYLRPKAVVTGSQDLGVQLEQQGGPSSKVNTELVPKLTTAGFVQAFTRKRKRAPTAAEIAAFEAEHPQ